MPGLPPFIDALRNAYAGAGDHVTVLGLSGLGHQVLGHLAILHARKMHVRTSPVAAGRHRPAPCSDVRWSEMAESVYRVTTLVGTSTQSWETAAQVAIDTAAGTLRDLRVARIVEQDVHIEPDKPLTYRVRLELSFKYERTNGASSNGANQSPDVDLVDTALEA
jgi:flavin-binding protein dodecin